MTSTLLSSSLRIPLAASTLHPRPARIPLNRFAAITIPCPLPQNKIAFVVLLSAKSIFRTALVANKG